MCLSESEAYGDQTETQPCEVSKSQEEKAILLKYGSLPQGLVPVPARLKKDG